MATRSDAWEASLGADVALELYRLTKKPSEKEAAEGRPWLRDFDRDVLPHLSLQGIVAPARSSWYRFLGRMRKDEAEGKIARLMASKSIAERMAEAKVDPRVAFNVFTSMAMDEATKDDAERNNKAMELYASAAAMFATSAQKDEKLKLDAARQRTADEQLRLAREKFEFDAAKQAMAKAAEIKKISADDTLAADEKIAKVRAALFGVE